MKKSVYYNLKKETKQEIEDNAFKYVESNIKDKIVKLSNRGIIELELYVDSDRADKKFLTSMSKSKLIKFIKDIIGKDFEIDLKKLVDSYIITIKWDYSLINVFGLYSEFYITVCSNSTANRYKKQDADKYSIREFKSLIKRSIKEGITEFSEIGLTSVTHTLYDHRHSCIPHILTLKDTQIEDMVSEIIGSEFKVLIRRTVFNSALELTIKWDREVGSPLIESANFYRTTANQSWSSWRMLIEKDIEEVVDVFVTNFVKTSLKEKINLTNDIEYKLPEMRDISYQNIKTARAKKIPELSIYLQCIISVYIHSNRKNKRIITRLLKSKLGWRFKVRIEDRLYQNVIKISWR